MDLLEAYDALMKQWLETTFGAFIKGHPIYTIVSTPERMYAQLVSDPDPDTRRIRLPRLALTRFLPVKDPMRFPGPGRVRRMAYTGADRKFVVQSKRPTPLRINYQLDFYTDKQWMVNLLLLKLSEIFHSDYIYFTMDLTRLDVEDGKRAIWQQQTYSINLEGEPTDNSDLEPGEETRKVRFTWTVRADAWIFYPPEIRRTAEQFRISFYDQNDNTLLETVVTPPSS